MNFDNLIDSSAQAGMGETSAIATMLEDAFDRGLEAFAGYVNSLSEKDRLRFKDTVDEYTI